MVYYIFKDRKEEFISSCNFETRKLQYTREIMAFSHQVYYTFFTHPGVKVEKKSIFEFDKAIISQSYKND